jgi:hypothetical protein
MTLLEDFFTQLTAQKNNLVAYQASLTAQKTTCCDNKAALELLSTPSENMLQLIANCASNEGSYNALLAQSNAEEALVDVVLAMSDPDKAILANILTSVGSSNLNLAQNFIVKNGFDGLKAEYQKCVSDGVSAGLTTTILLAFIS